MSEEIEIEVINTLNGRRNRVRGKKNITYGDLVKSYALAPPDVVWTILDEDGNDITNMEIGDSARIAHITPGRDIAGG